MFRPSGLDRPCEHTIEVQSNHYILHHLNSASAWFFCPTPPEEDTLGFDAALQNVPSGKFLVIQYKRISQVNKNKSLRIDLDQDQLDTLRDNFPAGRTAYVFYGFSVYPTYQNLDDDYMKAGGPYFFENMRFVNVHDLPAVVSSMNYSDNKGVRPTAKGKSGNTVRHWNGHQLVCGLIECPIGITSSDYQALPKSKERIKWGTNASHYVSILIWRRKERRATKR